ncbi:gag-pol polyprotein, partial [Pseudoloma neurophilia]
LVSKPDGSKRFCIDFCQLNDNTIKQNFPIPHTQDLYNSLKEAKIFSKIYLEAAYHQVRMNALDEEKTGLIAQDRCYQWKVLPFGLKNVPFTFQKIVQNVLKEFMSQFVLVYIDDICVYSDNEEQYLRHLRCVLQRLTEVGFFVNLKKCQFLKSEVSFLGFRIGNGKMSIPQQQIREVIDFENPKIGQNYGHSTDLSAV